MRAAGKAALLPVLFMSIASSPSFYLSAMPSAMAGGRA
jgi:hypothetical protein